MAYRSGDSLARLIDSLAGEVDEVVVVDNAGEETSRPEVDRLLRPETNLGFAAGSNLGAQEASGDVLVFLNPDTVVGTGAVRELARTLEDPNVGIVMARLRLLDEPEKLNSSGVQVHVTGIGWAGGYGEPADSITEVREVPAPSGTAMAMRAETFRELGGFAEELFMYLEDLDWGWLLRNGGTVWRRRRHTQALRRQRDRDLARYLTATFSPAMTPVPALLRVANPFVRGYWRLVRLAL